MLNKSFIQQFYNPTFMPEKLNLAEFIEIQEKDETVKEKVQKDIANSPLVKLLTTGNLPKPLTYEEALAIDEEITVTQEAIKLTKDKIASLLRKLDETGLSNGEISFKLDVSKNNQLKRAIQQVFGIKTDTITYSMYRAALEAKKKLEADEAKNYINLNWDK